MKLFLREPLIPFFTKLWNVPQIPNPAIKALTRAAAHGLWFLFS
ncbi:hypothetical protein D1BOALGB6SA_1869 [Olavius sp. associated proteobacterium Delta 1]|nr:hypothetical protein D1BOALGB6SA_1869 [Olavius sp. associated proteobacterium Delta 1]